MNWYRNIEIKRVLSTLLLTLLLLQTTWAGMTMHESAELDVIMNEDFEDNSYEQEWMIKVLQGNISWTRSTYDENSYMQMSGYNASGDNLESYLISPKIDFDTYNDEVLTFKTKNGYYRGTTLSVLISTNFDGSNVENAHWQELQVVIDESDNVNSYGSVFVASGDIDLSSFSGIGYIAFKYLGNSSDLTTTYQVDDVVVSGTTKDFSGTLVSNIINDKISFPYVQVGQESSVESYILSYNGVSGNMDITCPAEYFVSFDGVNWKQELSFDTEDGDGFKDVKIKFVPEHEYYFGSEVMVEHRVNDALPYILKIKPSDAGVPQDASTLSKDKTLDLVTWNLQFFGISNKATNSEASFNTKLAKVANKILELDADVYALQEMIGDEYHGDFLDPLVDKLNEQAGEVKYAGIMASRYSFYFKSSSADFPGQRTCFIYNTNSVSNIESFCMFSNWYDGYDTPDIEDYPGSDYLFWASGRLPQMMKAIVKVDGKSQLVNFVNIHAKCCDAADRRLADATHLIDELTRNYNDDNMVIMGDYNESYSSNGGSYASLYANRNEDYLHAAGSSIDHISVSNELYYEYQTLSNNTQTDIVTYSDHDPILVRLLIDSDKETQTITLNSVPEQKIGSSAKLEGVSSSNLPLEYVVVSGSATITGDMIEITGAGTIMVQAVQQGNDQYAPAFSELMSLGIAKNHQTITFDDIDDVSFDTQTLTLSASASSGLDVSYEVESGNASVNGNVLTILGAGEITIKARQQGDNDYDAADALSVTFEVLKADQTISFEPIPTKTIADESFELNATSSSGLELTFEVVSGGATVNGSTMTLVQAGEVQVKAMQSGDANYNAAEVSQLFIVEEKSGIDDEYAKQVSIYPNPVSNSVTIITPDSGNKLIRVVALSGKTMYEYAALGNKKMINVNELPNGLYFIQITAGDITIAKKMQIRH